MEAGAFVLHWGKEERFSSGVLQRDAAAGVQQPSCCGKEGVLEIREMLEKIT